MADKNQFSQKGAPSSETPEKNLRERWITAYALWLFLGVLGGHRFYLGRKNSGFAMGVVGLLFLSFGLFFYLLPGLGISPLLAMAPFLLWWVLDGIAIPKWLSQQ
ncbi:TM2 domain-containing protein [Kroppenstedtia eburnea]|uniref:TM2 domain-containing protein n=1 Tax=Kroppenstedtia eburnea TaxID=714067 RepID=UPI003624B53E